eukprot:g33887.t1
MRESVVGLQYEPKITVEAIFMGWKLEKYSIMSGSATRHCQADEAMELHHLFHTKNKKLKKLGITTSSKQASPGTTVDSDKIEVLSQWLNYCPTTKVDPIGLVADSEEFIRRMRVQEFFHKPQGVSSEPNETTNEPEQSTERSVVQRPKKK